jgi:hypothetical protein
MVTQSAVGNCVFTSNSHRLLSNAYSLLVITSYVELHDNNALSRSTENSMHALQAISNKLSLSLKTNGYKAPNKRKRYFKYWLT